MLEEQPHRMNRRTFLTSSLGAAALAAPVSAAPARQYYELRQYRLQSGRQSKLTNEFLGKALVPALNRLGISPVGVFHVSIGPLSPSIYVLMPAAEAATLVTAEARLGQDKQYLEAGAPFLEAPADSPALVRIESSLMIAFEGHPQLTRPPDSAGKSRVFELRTYESPSDRDHRRKVEMFNSGEYAAFARAGFWQIFYGDVVVGARLPCLTYMLGFGSLAERDDRWKAFGAAPEWKQLTGSQRFSFESIVSNVTNLILTPADYSQI